MKLPYLLIDAFTEKPLTGNPCAVFFDTDGLEPGTMQRIASEMNLSESAFVSRSNTADFRVRYFTPAEEIPLAGHPTIATTWALIDSGKIDLSTREISLELNDGPITVTIDGKTGSLPLITMTQRPPQFLSTHDPYKVMPIFGLTEDDLLPDSCVQTVSTGTPQLMIPLKGHASLRKAKLEFSAYTAYRDASDFFSPHLFCLNGFTTAGDVASRHFGVPPDTIEDPFTGSATGGMIAYLWHYKLIRKRKLIVEQGHWMGRPGTGYAEIIGPPDTIDTVRVSGTAVTVIRGMCEL